MATSCGGDSENSRDHGTRTDGRGHRPGVHGAARTGRDLELHPVTALRQTLENMKGSGGEASRAPFEGRTVRIWSDEHRMWWRRDFCGYTKDVHTAGIYPFTAAWRATKHCGPDKMIIFEAVESPDEPEPAVPLQEKVQR